MLFRSYELGLGIGIVGLNSAVWAGYGIGAWKRNQIPSRAPRTCSLGLDVSEGASSETHGIGLPKRYPHTRPLPSLANRSGRGRPRAGPTHGGAGGQVIPPCLTLSPFPAGRRTLSPFPATFEPRPSLPCPSLKPNPRSTGNDGMDGGGMIGGGIGTATTLSLSLGVPPQIGRAHV